ncbi:MAG: hypothetical protein WAQ57_01245 [Candidatus Saccharimonadales bacterium]
MDEDEDIRRDVESPVDADDHMQPGHDIFGSEDDMDDNFGRELPDVGLPSGTHPRDDTDFDSTEQYQERPDSALADDDYVEEKLHDEEEEQDYI